jgi:nitroreductase
MMNANESGRDGPGVHTLLGPNETNVLLRAATRAPSLHNSQPWAFAVGPRRVEVFANPLRQLRNTDPTGRSLLISCGAALFNLRVAAEYLGFHPRVRLLPDDHDRMLVAVVEVDHRHRQRGGIGAHYAAIPARRTNRRPFREKPIPHSVLTLLVEAARAEGAMLRIYDDADEVARIVDVLQDADLADYDAPARTTERQAWVGGGRRDDGIPVHSLGPRPSEPRTAFRDLGQAVGVPREYAAFESTPTVAILSTLHDERVDWLRAGQALERLLLAATAAGVSASVLNQPLEQDDLRRLVRSPATGVGHSHMILRLGYGDEVPATPRRPIAQVRRPLRDTP